jgi:hypothetical protein
MEEVKALPTVQWHAIRKRMGPTWQQILDTPSVSWLSEVTYNSLTEAIRAELGDMPTQQLYRRVGRRVLSNPNFQSFIESAIRLFGLSPHTLLKVAPRARASVVNYSGTMTYQWVSERCARLHLRDFPASTFASGTTIILLSGTWLGLLDAAGVASSARVATENVDLRAGHTTFVLTW